MMNTVFANNDEYVGFAWHVHHDKLIEWCYSLVGRRNVIRQNKPESEQETRLRLLAPVQGVLPDNLVRGVLGDISDPAYVAYVQAGDALDRAEIAYTRPEIDVQQARSVLLQATVDYSRAKDVLYAKMLEGNMPAVLALHAQECLDCPWDGQTIFPENIEKNS